MSKNIKDVVQKSNIMKDDFGWEVPYELAPIPSQGIIYTPDSIMYKKEAVKIKAMTAREEDILASQALIKEGTVIDHLINSCVSEKAFNSEDLILGDRNALMIAIRVTGYGPEYGVKVKCEDCGHLNSLTLNLSDIPIKRLKINPVKEGSNLFEFKLPVTKKKVRFKFVTAKDERDKAARSEALKRHTGRAVSETVTAALIYAIESVDGITDKNKIRHFVMNMPAFDSKSLRKFMRENEPGMDMNHDYTCENCSHQNNFMIPVTTEFFWPST